jgi:acetylornithine deacetylase
LIATPASTATALAKRLTNEEDELAVSYGTEAGFFQKYGYSVVVCGPGSIENAHQPNEFIAVSEVERCEKFIDDLLVSLCQ